jgi:hypothetical protein
MAKLIRELPRFYEDCKHYQTVIERVAAIDEKKSRELNTMYQDFLLKVESVDRSVEDMVSGFVAVGLQHSTFVEELKKIRLRLDKEINLAEKTISSKNIT